MRFLIQPKDIKLKAIYPEAREENEEDISKNLEQSYNEFQIKFVQPVGAVGFVVPETRENGQPIFVNFSNQFRTFSFNPVDRIVSLKMQTDSGHLISLALPLLENKSRIHRVLFWWDYSKGGGLGLNGKMIEDMGEPD